MESGKKDIILQFVPKSRGDGGTERVPGMRNEPLTYGQL